MKLTADTVTDKQIEAVLVQAEDDLARYGLAATREVIAVCKSALNPYCHEARRDEARARCAELINARAGGKP